jgi:hypothetical protein
MCYTWWVMELGGCGNKMAEPRVTKSQHARTHARTPLSLDKKSFARPQGWIRFPRSCVIHSSLCPWLDTSNLIHICVCSMRHAHCASGFFWPTSHSFFLVEAWPSSSVFRCVANAGNVHNSLNCTGNYSHCIFFVSGMTSAIHVFIIC